MDGKLVILLVLMYLLGVASALLAQSQVLS